MLLNFSFSFFSPGIFLLRSDLMGLGLVSQLHFVNQITGSG